MPSMLAMWMDCQALQGLKALLRMSFMVRRAREAMRISLREIRPDDR
jgi:hypothetical protein